jgi:hypothetical protein
VEKLERFLKFKSQTLLREIIRLTAVQNPAQKAQGGQRC